jgi:uncharacterized protein YbcI
MRCRFCPNQGKHFQNKICPSCTLEGRTIESMGTRKIHTEYFNDIQVANLYANLLRQANIQIIKTKRITQWLKLSEADRVFKDQAFRLDYLVYDGQEPVHQATIELFQKMIKDAQAEAKKAQKAKVAV